METISEMINDVEKSVDAVASVVTPFIPQAAIADAAVHALGGVVEGVADLIDPSATTVTAVAAVTVTSAPPVETAPAPALVPVEVPISSLPVPPVASSFTPVQQAAFQAISVADIASAVTEAPATIHTDPQDAFLSQLQNRLAEAERVLSILAPIVGSIVPQSAPLLRGVIADEAAFNRLFDEGVQAAEFASSLFDRVKNFFENHLQNKV